MLKKYCKFLFIFFISMQFSCSNIAIKNHGTTKELSARSAKWNDAFARKNIAELMELFSKDAQFASAGGKWKEKEEGLRKFSALLMKRPDLQWEIHPKEIIVNEAWEVAYETGSWEEWWQEPDGLAKITGTYFMMWKKTKLEPWLIHAAIFTPLCCSGESAYCRPHEGRS